MTERIRIIKHRVAPKCGSYEFDSLGRPSKFFYWEDIPGRRLTRDRPRSAG